FYEDGLQLPRAQLTRARISLPSDRSFTTYESALGHITTNRLLDDTVDVPWRQAMLDVMLTVPIGTANAHFALEPTLSWLGLKTTTVVHFLPAGGAERVFEYDGDP